MNVNQILVGVHPGVCEAVLIYFPKGVGEIGTTIVSPDSHLFFFPHCAEQPGVVWLHVSRANGTFRPRLLD